MKDDSVREKAMDKLVGRELRAGLKPASSSCMDAEILAAYVERTLSPRERADCEGHLVSCSHCQEHVAALVRLSEADEPAQVRAAASPARAARPSWFRLAFAGPVLAAVLVAGIYFVGPFSGIVQSPPETRRTVQRPSTPPQPPSGIHDQVKGEPSSTAKKNEVMPAENKTLDDKSQRLELAEKNAPSQPSTTPARSEEGTSALTQTTTAQNPEPAAAPPTPAPAKSTTEEAQVNSQNAPTPKPAPSVGSLPVRSQEIATPSVRVKIAQSGPAENGASGGRGAGIAVGGTAGALSNNLARKNSKDEDNVRPAQRQHDATGTVAKEEADVAKAKSQNEAMAKTDSVPAAPTTTETRDREQRKQEGTPSFDVSAASRPEKTSSVVSLPTWRVGRHGLIAQRDDNGNWKKQKSGVKADLNEISFANPQVGWAVGQAGTILRSTDGGETWTKLPSPTTEDIVHVKAISESAASIVTRGGETLSTADGGTTWNPESQ